MNKGLIVTIIVVIVAVAGFLLLKPKNNSQVASNSASNNAANTETPPATSDNSTLQAPATTTTPTDTSKKSTTTDANQGTFSGEGDIQSPDVQVFEVNYDGTNFSPKTTTIKAGDIVVFKNNGTTDFWPASDPHPTHTNYPEFDAKQSIAPGGKYEFKFTKVGTWGYHNHKNHTSTGTIIVK